MEKKVIILIAFVIILATSLVSAGFWDLITGRVTSGSCTPGLTQNGYCFSLQQGWNLISIPLITPYTAESLLNDINNQGGNCNSIQRWDGSGWQTHPYKAKFNDFSIITGDGYFIYCNSATKWSAIGNLIIEPLQKELTIGWNLVGSRIDLERKAINQAIINCNPSKILVSNIDQEWTIIPNSSLIEIGIGYFVLCDTAGIWDKEVSQIDCIDPDALDYYKKEITKGIVYSPLVYQSKEYNAGDYVELEDYCFSNIILNEYSCFQVNSKSYITQGGISCPGGCKEGVCLTIISNCTDSDGGLNYYSKGETKGKYSTAIDFCRDDLNGEMDYCDGSKNCRVHEYFCDEYNPSTGDYVSGTDQLCLNGCKDGACIQLEGCIENWTCTSWSTCYNNQQTRTCTDSNSCGTTTNKPIEIQDCGITIQPFITDLKAYTSSHHADSSIELRWTAPDFDTTYTYNVWYSTSPLPNPTEDEIYFQHTATEDESAILYPRIAGEQESIIVQNLQPNTNYYFIVSVQNQTQNFYSNMISTKTTQAYTGFSTVAVLVDTSILNDNELKTKIDRYIEDIKNALKNVEVEMIEIDSSWTEQDIANKLRNLYVNNRLEGAVLIGWLPVPYIQTDEIVNFDGLLEWPTIYPYIDFENMWYLYNPKTNNFYDPFPIVNELKGRFRDSRPEIWLGLIQPPVNGTEGIKLLKSFFDKDHLYHTGSLYFEPRVLYTNTIYGNEIANKLIDNSKRWHSNEATIINTTPELGLEEAGLLWDNTYLENLEKNSYEIVYYHGHGAPTSHYFDIGYEDIKKVQPKALYVFIGSCNTGQFITENYLAGWYLFSGDTLAVTANTITVGGPEDVGWTEHSSFILNFADSLPIGRAIRKNGDEGTAEVLLGDPTISVALIEGKKEVVMGEEAIPCSGCLYNEKCLPIGVRVKSNYCDIDGVLKSQESESSICSNNYECATNVCVNDKCISQAIWDRFISWLKELFE